MAKLSPNDLNSSADALQADLKVVDRGLFNPVEVTGSFPRIRVPLNATGSEALTFKLKIVEALVDPIGFSALLVHVSGSLYFLLITNTKGAKPELTLYVLDGESLPLKEISKSRRFLPILWDRPTLLTLISPGVVKVFVASAGLREIPWKEVTDGKAKLLAQLPVTGQDKSNNQHDVLSDAH